MRHRKSLKAVLVITGFTTVLANSGCGAAGGGSGEGSVTLKLADYLPKSDYHIEQGLDVFVEQVEEKSEGSITFERYPAEQLASAPDLLGATGDGLADMSLIGVTYTTDSLPLASVCSLPGSFLSVQQGTEACWEVTQSDPIVQEYADNSVVPIYASVNEPYTVQTSDVEVSTVDDLNGLKLRAGGGDQSRVVQDLGATPVEMSGPEAYDGLTRGTVDGLLYPVLSLEPYDLQEPVQYGATGMNLGSFSHTMVVNTDVWDELSEEQQTILQDAGEEAMKTYAEWVDENREKEIKRLEESGEVDFTELPEDELSRWQEASVQVSEQWGTRLDSQGHAGTETWDRWQQALDAHAG